MATSEIKSFLIPLITLYIILAIASCGNKAVCSYKLENNISLRVVLVTMDISFTDYVTDRMITVAYNNKKFTFELGGTKYSDFYVRERKITDGSKQINTLWFYNIDNPAVMAINLDKMKVLADSLKSDGMTNWCSCSDDSCENNDCVLITGCQS